MNTCAFCPATEDLMACDWVVRDFVRSTYYRLVVGDKVKRIADKMDLLVSLVEMVMSDLALSVAKQRFEK